MIVDIVLTVLFILFIVIANYLIYQQFPDDKKWLFWLLGR